MSDNVPSSTASSLFDLRTVIAVLFAFYGLVLTIMGIVAGGPQDLAKSGGIDINLWTGLAMLVIAGGFLLWVRARPVEVSAPTGDPESEGDERPPQHH